MFVIMRVIPVLIFVHFALLPIEAVKISAKKTLIWGPGLEGRIALPARYFFIQTVDTNKRK